MHPSALHAILLIQTIEETDRSGELIPLADRADATRAVAREVATGRPALTANESLSPAAHRFLERRAALLLSKVRSRAPVVDQVLGFASGLTWVARGILLLAVAAGISLSALDGSRRINILAFPLIGLIAWNLLVYAALLIAALRASPASPRSGSAAWEERWIARRIAGVLRDSERFNAPLGAALRRFAREWSDIARPFLVLRAKQLLHVAAALLALGLIAGLYVRGLVLRYEAGWESTFLSPETAHALLVTLYGPAALLTGIGIPASDGIATLRWAGDAGGGEAAAWIHLIAVTAGLYIVVPRLLAALVATLQYWTRSRRGTLPPSVVGYARAILSGAGGGGTSDLASVVPYAYVPAPESVRGVQLMLAAALGGNVRVDVGDAVRYGEEEAIEGRLASGARLVSWQVLLMSLAATPEGENHGALIAATRDWLTQHASGTALLVVIDEAPYAARMHGDAGLEARMVERRGLWSRFVAGYGLRPCVVNLARLETGTVAETEARDAARAALWCADTP